MASRRSAPIPALALALAACSSPPSSAPPALTPAPATAVTSASAPTSAPSASALPVAALPAPPQPPTEATDAGPPLAVRFRREIEAPVTFIALEQPPHAAALARDAVWMHDARGWHAETLPASARASPGVALSLFYGRDDRVRVVGARAGDGATRGIYLRWLPSGYRVEKSEIGRLGSLRGPLVAVLGTADPEIVCQPGDVCLVKRRSGWTTIDAPADIARVTLGEGVGWGVAGRQLLKLGARWESAGPPGTWESADALFALRDRAWVVETGASRIHAFDGTSWRVMPSPIEHPRALWGARADALWLAGEGGLAHGGGTRWRRVDGAPAPLAAVLGRSAEDVWVGGERGLHRLDLGP